MNSLVFLVEEPSMAAVLETWLPTFFPELNFMCLPHEGKSDLRKSIPRKLRAWQQPNVKFVVLMDNDGRDCRGLKRELLDLCFQSGRPDTLIRIVCQELEAWYLGDPSALAEAFGRQDLVTTLASKKFRDPDSVTKPSLELTSRIPEFQKIKGAKLIAEHLLIQRNTSTSFGAFVTGIEQLIRRDP